MPYKDIEKRRESQRRWCLKNKEKKAQLRVIQNQAYKNNKERQICSIKGCDNLGERHHPDYSKPTEIIWLCKKHHEMVHHNKVCIICGDKHRARGYCNKHWKKWRKGKL